MIIQPNIIIRKYCGLSSQLLKEQKNNIKYKLVSAISIEEKKKQIHNNK